MSEAETIQRLESRIENLTDSVKALAVVMGARLNREQMCQRLGVHRNTLARMAQAPGFPQPDRTGKWLLSEVIEWERRGH